MLPKAYLALTWTPGRAEGAARVQAIEARLAREPGWRRCGATDRSALWLLGPAGSARVLPFAAGFVVGDLFPTAGVDARTSPFHPEGKGRRNPVDLARRLARAHWGRYVALLHGPPPVTSALFRDPSGQVGCLTWRLGDGVAVAASDLQGVPSWLWPPRLALHWGAILGFLAGPAVHSGDPLFDGISAVRPGDLQALGADPSPPVAIWRPADFVVPAADPKEAAHALVTCVDACTAALVQGYDRVLVELSGGLDSAIVAGALGAMGLSARVVSWLNFVGDRREGDERAFARSVTDRLGVTLTTVDKPVTPLTEAGLMEFAAGAWPSVNGVDEWRDRDELAELEHSGAEAIVSGQGGDAVFFQRPTPLVMADELRRYGLRGLRGPVLADIARRTRRSVWSVLMIAIGDRGKRGALGYGRTLAPAAARPLGAMDLHPWIADAQARGVSTAKRVHMSGLIAAQMLHGASRRARRADLLYPLLSQPVVELCLSIAAPDLAGGAFDRPFARAAFAERAPEIILQRRSKGDLTSYFSRLVAVSLPVLRPLLLDGCLCAAGVLDRRDLEAALRPEQLIWQGAPSEILWAATIEAWVRHWQGRMPDSEASPRQALWARP